MDPIDMDLIREQSREAARMGRELSRVDMEAVREAQMKSRGTCERIRSRRRANSPAST